MRRDDHLALGAVGQAAAELLIDSVSNGQVVAVGNGRSIQAAAQRIPQIPRVDCTIVQLLDSIPSGLPSWGRDAPTICTRIASQLGAKVSRMPVPLIVDNPSLLRPLMREEKVATTLALAARADVALVGVAGVEAIVGAIRGGILSALATDYQTALSILDML